MYRRNHCTARVCSTTNWKDRLERLDQQVQVETSATPSNPSLLDRAHEAATALQHMTGDATRWGDEGRAECVHTADTFWRHSASKQTSLVDSDNSARFMSLPSCHYDGPHASATAATPMRRHAVCMQLATVLITMATVLITSAKPVGHVCQQRSELGKQQAKRQHRPTDVLGAARARGPHARTRARMQHTHTHI